MNTTTLPILINIEIDDELVGRFIDEIRLMLEEWDEGEFSGFCYSEFGYPERDKILKELFQQGIKYLED